MTTLIAPSSTEIVIGPRAKPTQGKPHKVEISSDQEYRFWNQFYEDVTYLRTVQDAALARIAREQTTARQLELTWTTAPTRDELAEAS